MGDDITSGLKAMMGHPPDPNAPIPLANYPSTMYGVTIPFHILSWTLVGLRLHTRLKIVRKPGWDDLFVLLAALFNLLSVVAFLESINHGLGKHMIYIIPQLQSLLFWLYLTNAAYHTTTTLIKISLLLQYLRMFRQGARRVVCIVLLVLITMWGLAYAFLAWVPCIPVSGFWNRVQTPTPKCYGFAYQSAEATKLVMLTFGGTNMFFDMAIFAIPLSEYFTPHLRRKQLLAMTGLFAMGSVVVLMAILRLWSTFRHGAGQEGLDFTYWYPEVLIFSCLEIDFAIMCASMPIFWPTVVASWSQIFVTKEVHVVHQRLGESESGEHFELERRASFKSEGSQEGLTAGKREFYEHGAETKRGQRRSVAMASVEVKRETPYGRHVDTFP